MLDLTIYKSRYYPVKISENEIINVEPPKRKQLKKILELTKNMKSESLDENDIDNLYEAITIAINKNKENKILSSDKIDDIFSLNALYAFFEGYYTWVADNLDQKN
jgi:hypothetical protein